MQISPGMKISDVCSFCYEHTIDQRCPEYDAWLLEQGYTLEMPDYPEVGEPCCYGFFTSAGQDHEVDCPKFDGRF